MVESIASGKETRFDTQIEEKKDDITRCVIFFPHSLNSWYVGSVMQVFLLRVTLKYSDHLSDNLAYSIIQGVPSPM